MTLSARWFFVSEKKNIIGWSAACGRMTIFTRWGFFSEKIDIIGWNAACGRVTLFARGLFLAKIKMLFDGAEHVGG